MPSLASDSSQISNSETAPPRKLRRPQFVFFQRLTLALAAAFLLLQIAPNTAILTLLMLFGGSLWLVMAFVLAANWQVVKLDTDALQIVNYGKKTRVSYAEIRDIKATRGERDYTGPIALPTLHVHRTGGHKPLIINLSLLHKDDRRALPILLCERAPKAHLVGLAKDLAAGKWSG